MSQKKYFDIRKTSVKLFNINLRFPSSVLAASLHRIVDTRIDLMWQRRWFCTHNFSSHSMISFKRGQKILETGHLLNELNWYYTKVSKVWQKYSINLNISGYEIMNIFKTFYFYLCNCGVIWGGTHEAMDWKLRWIDRGKFIHESQLCGM